MIFFLFKVFIFVFLKPLKVLLPSRQRDPGPNPYLFLALINNLIQTGTLKVKTPV